MPGSICLQPKVIGSPTKRSETIHSAFIQQMSIPSHASSTVLDCRMQSREIPCSQEGYVLVGEEDHKHHV